MVALLNFWVKTLLVKNIIFVECSVLCRTCREYAPRMGFTRVLCTFFCNKCLYGKAHGSTGGGGAGLNLKP